MGRLSTGPESSNPIGQDTLANFQEITSDHIGTSRNLMQLCLGFGLGFRLRSCQDEGFRTWEA